MKHKVTITIELEMKEYYGAGETPKDAVNLTKEIIDGHADWPDSVDIDCGSQHEIYEPLS